ncbi:alpha-amylase family glycosyl hydrolase [Virgibacillus alimentarius]|uniref:alpha-amylase family glycosyl hydrolase n=1 Tax=Virgibacillus alimentarius TaxID=698769 RepID=UPI0004933C02|nr:alpha-amylase family glycosyl hydrolase [Virgibacillus alimentarius]
MKKVVLILLAVPFLLIGAKPIMAENEAGLQEEIIYNILVDRYNNGDNTLNGQVSVDDPYAYHGGDIKGIIDKLDEIQEHGFTAITLSPIMENADNGYHGYWIEDYYNVEQQFGTMEDVQTLVEEAHKRDMKVILEFVTNYVADSHEIISDPDKADWLKENKLEIQEETKWLEHAAVLNQENPAVREYLFDAAAFWINETDIDGFKLHAADMASDEFLKKFTSSLKEINPDLYILADVMQDNQRIKELKNIPAIDAVDNQKVRKELNEVFDQSGQGLAPLNQHLEEKNNTLDLLSVDNKNTKRFSQAVAENGRKASTVWQLALTYMYTTPGVPSIYQGSEIPMYGEGVPESQMMVLFNSGEQDIPEFLGRISSIRTEFPALVHGDYEEVGSSGAMSVFKRTYKDETLYVAINNDSESRSVSVTDIDSGLQLKGLLGDNLVREKENGEFKIGIPRETAEIYVVEEDTGINWLFIAFILGVFFLFIFAVIYLSRKQKKRN